MSLTSSVPLGGTIDSFYRDQAAPNSDHRSAGADTSFYGASGMFVNSGVPDTDPAYTNPPASVKWVRSTTFGSPVADPSTIPAKADGLPAGRREPVPHHGDRLPRLTSFRPELQ